MQFFQGGVGIVGTVLCYSVTLCHVQATLAVPMVIVEPKILSTMNVVKYMEVSHRQYTVSGDMRLENCMDLSTCNCRYQCTSTLRVNCGNDVWYIATRKSIVAMTFGTLPLRYISTSPHRCLEWFTPVY